MEKSSGRLEHSSRISDDLASDSEDGKKLKAVEARALRKQKFKVKNNCFFFSANQHVTKHRTTPKVLVPGLFVPSSTITKPISSINSTTTWDISNKNNETILYVFVGYVPGNDQGFVSDVEKQVHIGTNVELAKEH